MSTHNLPEFSAFHHGVKGNNPEQVFKFLSWEIAKSCGLVAIEIYERFEQFSSQYVAGMGDGVAIFDWKQAGLAAPYLIFSRLENPVAFTALDDRPVDMVVTLISPEEQGPLHLRHLSRLSRLFRDTDMIARLRDVASVDGLAAILSPHPMAEMAAA